MTITIPYSLFEDNDSYQVEYELTDDELYQAFLEQEHIFDKMDVECYISGWDDEDVVDSFGITREQFENFTDAIAYRMRSYMSKGVDEPSAYVTTYGWEVIEFEVQ